MHDAEDHVTLSKNVGHIEVVGVGASMDDPVHVQVQVIELGEQRLIGNDLVDLGVALAEPAIKLKGVGDKQW